MLDGVGQRRDHRRQDGRRAACSIRGVARVDAVIARRLVVRGRVQGVGYRFAMTEAALALGVAGWVRNRRDGTVEAVVQGDDASVERLLEWCRRGPPGAHVTAIADRGASTSIPLCEDFAAAAPDGIGEAPRASRSGARSSRPMPQCHASGASRMPKILSTRRSSTRPRAAARARARARRSRGRRRAARATRRHKRAAESC